MDRPELDYQALFDASPNPYLVLDRSLDIVGANRAYLKATGRTLDDIVGRWAWDAFPTDPETLRIAVASFERVLRTRQPHTIALLRFDIPSPDGAGGFDERYWSIVHEPVLDATGEVALVLQHPIDVTEMQRLRDSVRDAEKDRGPDLDPAQSGIFTRARTLQEANWRLQAEGDRLRGMFEQAPGFVCMLHGPDHRFGMANDAYMRLVGNRGLAGRPVRDALPELEGQGFYELLDRVYTSGETFVGRGLEIVLDATPGDTEPRRRFVDFVYQPVRDPTGDVAGIFVQGSDVTDAKHAELALREVNDTLERRVEERTSALATEQREHAAAQEQLRQSQKLEAVGQLTGGVAHDFNNLLTVIRSSADLLRRRDLPEERRARYVDAISTTVDRAAKLTGQLLAFARRQALKPETFDVGERLGSVSDMLNSVVGARIKVETRVPDAHCHVLADVSQFETALVNMAVNARDAMDGEGTLTLSVDCGLTMPPIRGHAGSEGRFVAVSLTDTGVGISSEAMGRIFEPFFTTKEVGKGTGLGLSQVFGFAKQSGGDVDVESRGGVGTTFTLYLPQVEPEGTIASGMEASALVAKGAGRRVLVVEDNLDVGAFSTQLLQDLGYRTTWATNAEEALRLLSEDASAFDVVFSDVVMPGMNGIELGQCIRRLHPDLPVILTSGYSHVLAEEGRHGFDLLQKPYSVEALSRILRKAPRRNRGRSDP